MKERTGSSERLGLRPTLGTRDVVDDVRPVAGGGPDGRRGCALRLDVGVRGVRVLLNKLKT